MAKTIKILLKLGAVVLVLAVLALITGTLLLKKYLPPEKLRDLIVSNAEKTLKRQVRLKGISLNLVKGLGIQGLEISESPDFKAGSFAQINSFDLRIQWLPLLRKKIIVNRIALDGLRLTVVKGNDGRWNAPELGQAPEKAQTSTPSGQALPLELNIHRAAITHGHITYRDAVSGTQWILSDLSLKTKDFSLAQPFESELEFKAAGRSGQRPMEIQLAFAGTIDLARQNPDKMAVGVKKLAVQIDGNTLKVSGTWKSVTSPQLDLKTVWISRGSEILTADINAGVQAFSPLEAQATLKAQSRAFRPEELKLEQLQGAPDVQMPPIDLQAKIQLNGETLRIESSSFKTKLVAFNASGVVHKISSQPEPQLDIALKSDLPAFQSKDIAFLPNVPPGLSFPASQMEGSLKLSRDEVHLSPFRLAVGKNEIESTGRVEGLRSGKPDLDLVLKCKSFVLEELTQISPQTRDMKLSGNGFFTLAMKGKLEKLILFGKLQFKGLGATVSDLKLEDFTGTAQFDERRIDLPNLKGRVGDGDLALDLTIKNYSTQTPEIDLEASLTQLDLGKILSANKTSAQEAPDKSKAAAPEKKSDKILKAKGKFSIAKLIHPNIAGESTNISWDLSGITPDLKNLGGWAKFHVGGGRFSNLWGLAGQSKIVKVLIFPLMIIQKIGSVGGVQIFPDLSNIEFSEIVGDYAFSDGVMTLRDCRLESEAAKVSSQGSIDLPAEKLDLVVTAQVARVAPIDVTIKGTFDKPSPKINVGKFIAEPAKQLIAEPAKKLLEKFLKR